MIKKILSLILILVLIFSLTSCGGSDGKNVQMIFPIDKDPLFLDPQICSYSGALNIINNCFEGLVKVNEDGQIVEACAKSYEVSSDGLKYTFHLRNDLKWRISSYSLAILEGDDYKNDGDYEKKITAHDFAFALERAIMPETQAPFVSSLFAIKNAEEIYYGKQPISKLGVKVIDDLTLQIQLGSIDPDFLYTLTTAIAMPCNEEFFNLTGGRYGLSTKYLLYNGAFYISNWSDKTAITANKNQEYYDSENVNPSSLYFSINNEWETRAKKVISGTYEVSPIEKSQLGEFSSNKKNKVLSFQSSTLSLVYNCADPILSNQNMRIAISSCLDKSRLDQEISLETASGILPTSVTFSNSNYNEQRSDLKLIKYNEQKAKQLFETGLDEIKTKSVELKIICSKEHEKAVRSLIQNWQSVLGINFAINVESMTEKELQTAVKDKNFQIALTDVNFKDSTAFNALEKFLTNSTENIFGFADEKFDSMIDNIKSSHSKQTMLNNLKAAEQYIINKSVVVPLYEQNIYFALADNVSGVRFSPTGEIVNFSSAIRP